MSRALTRIEFKAAQSALMRAGNPEDACGRCGCRRRYHLPAQASSQAPTSCECKHCLCFCVEFMEPFPGQPRERCHCEPVEELPWNPETEFTIVRSE